MHNFNFMSETNIDPPSLPGRGKQTIPAVENLRMKKLSLQYAIKQSSRPNNPAHKYVFKTDPRTRKSIKTLKKFAKPFSLRISDDLSDINISKNEVNIRTRVRV